MTVLKMTHSVNQPQSFTTHLTLETFHRHVRPTKQSCAFTVHIINPLTSTLSEESQQVVGQHGSPPSSHEFLKWQMHPFIQQNPSVFHQSSRNSKAWLVTNLSIDISFLCGKVHIHLKNINLFPSLVASPKPQFVFTFPTRNRTKHLSGAHKA